jgi:hypothetical protein
MDEMMKEIELSIETQKLEKELKEHKGDIDYCSDLIANLTEEQAKGILKHLYFN